MSAPASTPSIGSSRIGIILVTLQFIALTVIALHAGPALDWWPSACFLGLSALIMVWSLLAMGKTTFRVHPQPAKTGTLRTGGIYRLLRHPMYSAVLIASLTVLWTHPSWLVLLATIVAAIVLRAKILIEEQQLRQKFPGYSDYAERVPAIIPFLPRKGRALWQTLVLVAILAPSLWLPFETHWDARLFADEKTESDSQLYANLSAEEARSLLDQKNDILIIDVRSEWEARGMRLPGAHHTGRSKEQLAALAQQFDQDTPILVYCAGGFRSRLAITPLKELGFHEIYHLDRGIMAWKLGGFPTETAAQSATFDKTKNP